MFSDGAERTKVMLWRRDCPAMRSWFQILTAATGKARLPTVESLKGGTTGEWDASKNKKLVRERLGQRVIQLSMVAINEQ